MVTAALREQLHRVDDPAGVLVLLQLAHPAMATAYVVNDTRDWAIGSQVWIGLPFRFRLPGENSQAPAAQIEIDNVGRALSAALEMLPAGAALQATIQLVSRAAPTVVEWEFAAPLSGVSLTTATVTATIGTDDELRAPAVALRYDHTTAPGLFEG